jgi:hypothetical protein
MRNFHSTRPAELRARNDDPLERRLSSIQLKMLLADNWEIRAELWRKVLALLAQRPRELVERLEAERLERARRAP